MRFLSILLFFNIITYSQTQKKPVSEVEKLKKIESYILTKQLDSAEFYISQIKDSEYLTVLKDISNNHYEKITSYKRFLDSITTSKEYEYSVISKFIDENIKIPNQETFNKDYFQIKLNQISTLSDDVKTIDQSTLLHSSLERYLQKFNENEREVTIAKSYLDFHKVILLLIQKKNLEAKQILDRNLNVAKQFEDKNLEVASLYHSCNYYMNIQDLQGYISTCEQMLDIESNLPKHSKFYKGAIMNTLDAYIYKGGYEDKVDKLLLLLYNNPKTREDSYAFYAKYLAKLPLDSKRVELIFRQFGVNNLIDFGKKIKTLAKSKLNSNDYYYIFYEMSVALETHGFLKEALLYQRDAVVLNRQIYSEDLSKALANFQTQQAIKEKELALDFAEKKSTLYIIIASLISLVLFFTTFLLIKNKKQTKQLHKQNLLINKALNENKLLVKEIHHRVKNNFQMVSSLLDLQTRGIEDKKAKELAIEGQNRIKSMALIHQKLYQKEDGLINFSDFLKKLVTQIKELNLNDKEVEVTLNTDSLNLDVDTAIPLGLIVNELLTNAFKYALEENKTNIIKINVEKKSEESYELIFSDNGKGIQKEIDVNSAKSLGLKLINRLTKQLNGEISYQYNNGAVFTITFKDAFQRKQVK